MCLSMSYIFTEVHYFRSSLKINCCVEQTGIRRHIYNISFSWQLKNKLECYITLGWNVLIGTNALAYLASGLYYKNFMIVIYDHNVIGQYYKTTIVAKASPS